MKQLGMIAFARLDGRLILVEASEIVSASDIHTACEDGGSGKAIVLLKNGVTFECAQSATEVAEDYNAILERRRGNR